MADKDLCYSCLHHWAHFYSDTEIEPHCGIVDRKYGFRNMNEFVPYPIYECPFNAYKQNINE